MPKVHHVKRARKPNAVITQNDIDTAKQTGGTEASYYWWEFRNGPKRMSKTYPRQSQLTMSEFLSRMYAMNERIEDLTINDFDDFEEIVDELVTEAEELGEMSQDSFDNMPDQLQYSETGERLEGRVSAMDDFVNELQAITLTIDISPVDEPGDEPAASQYPDEDELEAAHSEWEDKVIAFEEYESEIESAKEDILSELQGVMAEEQY